MSFLQNFHLSPGQTIRSTRGFKWNTAKQQDGGGYGAGSGHLTAGGGTGTLLGAHAITSTAVEASPGGLFTTPQKPTMSQPITDFNYTPSHQKPYIVQSPGTVVTSHKDIKQIVETTLGSEGVLNQAVKLPKGENLDEWIAVHCVDFYNQINMLYGSITEFCSPQTCPRMIATNEYEYLWNVYPGNPPVSVAAPKYVEYLMNWCQQQFDNEDLFPAKTNVPLKNGFNDKIAKPILKRLFRVYAHIYCHHFNEILELNLQTVLNTSFRHFCLFSEEFHMLKPSDYGPLLELVEEFKDR
ncbi:ADL236Wp [Eremothecium gossypii ATCC 10895]|uniref:ADL236Wp n=1 Tax=Eremothecium gossypii (strain ATCC 10895 / CBS 109.51 / FGSC 9923 / NRRL Y-1056) TaxID=284811 RepID=Q75B13_EREGS|nr:ADL236Wp [Eremothecium gossypii ATCC 10895]AAS51684.1 ADL236Wp [Eremothecium gossypii ATCC 10895]AEY95981.1 FADL236Wp [Eremothecium gossypii FDAG1]